jgi:hypothetical protein
VTAPIQTLLLLGKRREWVSTAQPPVAGENLARFGYPDWYFDEITEIRPGSLAYRCRLEAARPPAPSEPTGDFDPEDFTAT